jgi:transposase
MRFDEVYGRYGRGKLTCEEAADMLNVSVSTFYRSRQRYEAHGAEGLYDLRLGKASARRAPADEVAKVLELFETRYFDFRPKHFHEKLAAHGIERSYSWTKTLLQRAGKVAKAKRRGAHRRKRARKPLAGMMVHQDGSRHAWVAGVEWDLIVTMDDATSEVYSAFFVEEEGTMSSFQGLGTVIAGHGLFGALYADRGAHYWRTDAAGAKVDRDHPTQVKRALDQLGIELIAAYSPEARGRSERMFGTFQMRLPQELRVAGIADMAAANRFLAEVYLPQHNRRFASPAAEPGSAFVRYRGGDLADILCVQEDRVVGNDNTVRYNRLSLQIPPDRHRHHYVKARVRVHEYPDGRLAVFHGPRCLARYDRKGGLIDQNLKSAA